MMKTLSALLALFIISAAYAKDSAPIMPSLDWQKVKLKEELTHRVDQTLSKLLKKEHYLIDINIEIATPSKPRFGKSGNKDNKEAAGSDGGFDSGALTAIRVSDVSPDEFSEEYVIFHKLGIEAPLVDNFKDINVTQDGTVTNTSASSSEYEDLWKYNETLDIFKNLDHVSIRLKIHNSLNDETRKTIETILKETKFNLGVVQPKFKFDYLDLTPKFKEDSSEHIAQEGTWLEKIIESVAKFENFIGLVAATFLLGIFGIILMRMYRNILEDTKDSEQNINMGDFGDGDSDDGSSSSGEFSMYDQTAVQQMDIKARFITFFNNSEKDCLALLKTWLKEKNDEQKNALLYLAHEIDNDILTAIFTKLKYEEREQWKTYLNTLPKDVQKGEVQKYINTEIVKILMTDDGIDDLETVDMLLALTPENGVKFINENPELTPILMTSLNSNFLAAILNNLPKEELKKHIEKSITLKQDEISAKFDEFKKQLRKYTNIGLMGPFIEKVKDLIPNAASETEKTLYELLGKYGNIASVKIIAKENIPYEIMHKLPEQFLKEAMLNYDSSKRIHFLVSIEEHLKDNYVNLYAPDGSKARDILDLDYEKFYSDDDLVATTEDNKETIIKEFTQYIRKTVRKDKLFSGQISSLINEWASEIESEASQAMNAPGSEDDSTDLKLVG